MSLSVVMELVDISPPRGLVEIKPTCRFESCLQWTKLQQLQGLAQLVECRVWNANVVGSSPASLTKLALLVQLAEELV